MSEFPQVEATLNNEKTLESVFQVGNETVTVAVNPDLLKKNLINEAVSQGISEDIAKLGAENTKFMFGKSQDYYSQLVQDQASLLKKLPVKLASLVNRDSYYGYVGHADNTNTTCAISPETIAKNINSNYEKYSPEVRHAATTQLIDAVWRHERQHLIQQMNPEAKARMDKEYQQVQIINASAAGITTAAAVCINLPNTSVAMKGGLFLLIGASNLAIGAAQIYRNYYTKTEQEAFEREKPGYFTPLTPFKITFEK